MDFPSDTEHFNIHYVPSDKEIPAIRNAVRKGEEALKKIDGRMEELRQELRGLEERREIQEREVNRQKNLLAPIQRVNVDVLTSIFLSVLDVLDGDWLWIAAFHPALVISHVCRRWREVALATKVLWRHLHVRIPLYPCSSSGQNEWKVNVVNLVQMTKLWISRSENSHLNVKIIDMGGFLGGLEEAFFTQCIEFNELVEIICSSSTRWTDFYLMTGFPQAQRPNFPTNRLLTVQFTPALTTVELHCSIPEFRRRDPLNEHIVSSTNIFSAPTLRSLRISPRIMLHDLMHMPVTWSSLEHFSFDGYPIGSGRCFDVAQALGLFEECPNLVTCHLALQRDDVTIPIGRSPVPLQKLRALAFTPYTSQLPKGLAPFLILPSLRKLEVFTGFSACTPREYEESGLSEFFERFRPTLEDVTFCYKSLTQTGLHDCLGNLPNVTSLGLVSEDRGILDEDAGAANLNSDLFKHLTPKFDETGTPVTSLPLCPRIELFKFGAFRDEVPQEALVDFIEARRREVNNRSLKSGLTRLREVDCSHYYFPAAHFSQALRSRGVDLEAFSLTNCFDFFS
ncbi:hypothetical protein EST38_g6168 [Candolleomyces aberdarensis]|uniref:Uncharacterized protein n=1 Tax=Candolleomyces aberdarensis TaxID=2316362 RepID=A0A4Q2DIG2_9AGAR|nr:hypothetical protein EST38_g6168 [Candolleomyces aberdarensis]